MSEIKLLERQRKILGFIKGSPTITAKQMSEMLSVSQRTIERDISIMKEKGILRREGKDNDGVWVIVDAALKRLDIIRLGETKMWTYLGKD